MQFRFWKTISYHKVKNHEVLEYQQVFKYKTDKYNCLQKCKARLVICENQQKYYKLSTRDTTLALTFLCVLLAFTAKFDLETIQLNAINAFVYVNLNGIVFMHIPPRYSNNSKILRLNKAFYGL